MNDLVAKTAREMIEDLAARRVSAEELLDAHVARCEAVNPRLNAVVATDLDRARSEARATDAARAKGETLGALAGVPMTVKDCFDVDGLPSVAGNPAFANRPKRCADADLVKAVRAAGAIVWCKTNVPLMAGDFQSYNAVYGTTNNPYDQARTPGGSSGGAAAALAAGITPLEIGSDIGGSLRHPANFCGVASLKPTWSQLPMRGHVPPPPGMHVEFDLGVAGPMARTIGDLRLLYDVMAAAPTPTRPVKGARIALWTDDPEFPLATDVRAAIETAGAALVRQGASVERIAAPVDTKALMDSYFTLLAPIISSGFPEEVYAMLNGARAACLEAVEAGADRYSPAGYIVASTAPYRDIAAAQTVRQRLKDQLEAFFDDGWDAILSPITTVPAFPHTQDGQLTERTLDCDNQRVAYLHALDWIALATSLHAPAIAAPVARTTTGLPIGAQIITRWDNEARALDIAEALEREIGPLPGPLL
ncbi:MAG: amidase [Alphaproteobacteria bacterium]|nr:amidase [Alphaproteobacteria bacterium]